MERFTFEELTLSQTASLEALYALYCSNFPLPEEQETLPNFRRCLELNDDAAAQTEYGPYHEFYLAIREWNDDSGGYDAIVGGLIFGVCTSPEHLRHGFLCSVQAIYLFRTASAALKQYLYAGRAMLQATIARFAVKACELPRFRAVIGGAPAAQIAILFEVNNPDRMLPPEKQRDRDLSHLHPALRYMMWIKNHNWPLAFDYIQPPLSDDQQAATYLDLFTLESALDANGNPGPLPRGPDGGIGLPADMLAAHLRRFFCISVLKADAAAIGRASLPVPDGHGGTQNMAVHDYCRAVAAKGFIALRGRDDPMLQGIDRQARESSVTVAREMTRHAKTHGRHLGHWLLVHFMHLKRRVETVLMVLGLAALLFKFVRLSEEMPELVEWAHNLLNLLIALGVAAAVARRLFKTRGQSRRDFSPLALQNVLEGMRRDIDAYRHGSIAAALRDLLSDRAINHLIMRPLLPTATPAATDVHALGRFLASRTIAPRLADFGLDRFDSTVEKEIARIDSALRRFPPGALQVLDDLTPWHAYYTCIFPVREDATEGPGAYQKLEDFDVWIDTDAATMLSLDDDARGEALRRHHSAGRRICLFVSHIIDQPWDEADPGSLFELVRQASPADAARRHTTFDTLIAPHWHADAEIACARMLAVVMHLAAIMGRMAEHRQITTNLYCGCRVLIHVTAPPSVQLMRTLGFRELPRPESEEGEAEEDALDGTLLVAELEPGAEAFSVVLQENPTAAALFGLIDEAARMQNATAHSVEPVAV